MKQKIKIAFSIAFLLIFNSVNSSSFGQSLREDYPIRIAIESDNLSRGAYENFEEFLNNSPSITDSFYVETKTRSTKNWEGTTQVIPRLVDRDKKIKRVWGFSDGTDIYIFHQVEFFPILNRSDVFYFHGYDLMDVNEGAMVGGMLGGAIGGAIGGALDAATDKHNFVTYEIDLMTGNPVHPDHKAALELSRKNQFIIYRRSKKQSGENAVFTINDSLTYSFEPDSYVHLVFPPELPVKICSEGDEKNCVELTFTSDPITYVQVMLPEDSQNLELEIMSESKGEFDYYKTEKKQKKRGLQKPIEIK